MLLHFGAVDQTCTVWVNGVEAGGHTGGYLPFTLDVTDLLTGGEEELEVRVRDGGREEVDVNLPLDCVEQALGSIASGRVDVHRILSALHKADGTIVEVRNGDEHVRVSVW